MSAKVTKISLQCQSYG